GRRLRPQHRLLLGRPEGTARSKVADEPEELAFWTPGKDARLTGPAYGDPIHAQGRLADTHRHALAVLAAGADAVVELEVVADHAHAVEIGRTVADQHRALDRLRQLAALDLVGLGHLENVFAGGDVDLAAAKRHGIDAVLDRGDDLARSALAGEHIGIGHARHGHVGVALPPAIAGRFHVHETGVLTVLHVADENAVFDQHGAVGRRPFVVDRQRAAPLHNG